MATFKQVEEIQAWQKARALCKRIYLITNMINGLLGYLRRSGIKGTRFKR